jgi:hypothetical protein
VPGQAEELTKYLMIVGVPAPADYKEGVLELYKLPFYLVMMYQKQFTEIK